MSGVRILSLAAAAAVACGLLVAPSAAAAPSREVHAHVPASTSATKLVEHQLHALGLPVGTVDGHWDAYSNRGACIWRELTGRTPSRGRLSADERAELALTTSLAPARSMVVGMNVSRTCQTGTWVDLDHGMRVVRGVFPVSTGMPGHSTPTGTFRVQRQINGWHESTKYTGAMMYRPKYFNGGIALHGSITDSYVLPYPASHGCTRMLHRDIDKLWKAGFGIGDTVRVYGNW